jgi:hypothetical protein
MNPNTLDSPGSLESQEGQLEAVNHLENDLSGKNAYSESEYIRALTFENDGYSGLVNSDGEIAHVQSNSALFSKVDQEQFKLWSVAVEPGVGEQQIFAASPTYQGVYTNPNTLDSPGEGESQEGHLEAVDDLGSGLSGQSTLSGYEHIPASAFRSDGYPGAAVGYRFSVLGGTFPGGYVRNNSANSVCMAAPVYLPDGATVTQVSIFFMDDHPTLDMDNAVRLWRKNHASPGSNAEMMVDLIFPGVDATTIWRGYTSDIVSGTQIVSNNYGYYAAFCFHASTGLQHLVYGFRVDYDGP